MEVNPYESPQSASETPAGGSPKRPSSVKRAIALTLCMIIGGGVSDTVQQDPHGPYVLVAQIQEFIGGALFGALLYFIGSEIQRLTQKSPETRVGP